ncbi:hypothetical protein HII31_06838 [Pseudocercospora fuligena]|uniref:Suppressor of anucleate metulae protein B n=1 Tax=Pseudocercospora fuligena TaxID=685502 RepID=A0A8H6RIN1_9PEZI|nr:hypothetical protein HII31_06838 [Pseudocercospora fuligena]
MPRSQWANIGYHSKLSPRPRCCSKWNPYEEPRLYCCGVCLSRCEQYFRLDLGNCLTLQIRIIGMATPTESTQTLDTCTSCAGSLPRPVLACFDCSGNNINTSSPTYCSTRCRSDDRDSHLKRCNQQNVVRSIYRAGELLQDAFYTWRRTAFDVNLRRIRKDGETLAIEEDVFLVPDGKSVFFDFPDDQLPDTNDKHKLLSFLSCSEASAWMYELVKKSFEGISTSIEELAHQVPPSKVHIKRYYAHGGYDRNLYNHEVLAIDCRNGKSYIVDLAGAQYGQYQAVMLLDEYLSTKLGTIQQLNGHGYMRAVKKQGLLGFGLMTMKDPSTGGKVDIRIHLVQRELSAVFNAAVSKWEEVNSMSISQLLISEHKLWECGKEQLLASIKRKMRAWIDAWETAGCPSIALPLSEQQLSPEEEQLLEPYHASMGDGTNRSAAYHRWISQRAQHFA